MSFASQTPGTASPEQTLKVTNRGSAPLVVSGVALGGSDPDDFLVGNRCRQPVAVGASCQVGVRFDPQVQGARSASLRLVTNSSRQLQVVALSGGVATRSHRRQADKVEFLTCRRASDPSGEGATTAAALVGEICRGKLVSGAVKFKPTGASVSAALERGPVVYGSGVSDPTAGGGAVLLLSERRALGPGVYTLMLRQRRAHRSAVQHRLVLLD